MARSVLVATCLALLTGCATVADHYHPEALNEAAMDALVQGDVGTARILIERAARIDPNNTTIEHNRQMIVRVQKEGLSVREQGTVASAVTTHKEGPVVSSLSAIWPEPVEK